ncbi:MAG: hypothetical protein ACRCZP_14475 [Phycicoccus sp.]
MAETADTQALARAVADLEAALSAAHSARQARDDTIRDVLARGMPQRVAAEEASLTREQVRRIARRGDRTQS